MLERLCLKLPNIFQLPAVVALVARTAAPLQLGYALVGDLIRGPEVGLISANIDTRRLEILLQVKHVCDIRLGHFLGNDARICC